MKVYFLSSMPCALFLNGIYFGQTDSFERYTTVPLSDNVYAEFCPQGALPIRFFINENLRFSPPEGCEIYLLRDGIAIYAKEFVSTDFALRPIAQSRERDFLVSVFSQGVLQAAFESEKGMFISTLPPAFYNCQISFYQDLAFLANEKQLAIYTKTGTCLFCKPISSFSVENDKLTVKRPLFDCLQTIAEEVFILRSESCEQISRTVIKQKDFKRQEFLACMFFESLLQQGNFEEFLSEELHYKKDELCDFLGDFLAVFPTEQPNVCALMRKKATRIFEINYFSIEIQDGKIIDVKG